MGKTLTKQEVQENINAAYGDNAYKVLKMYKTASRDVKVLVQCKECTTIEEYSYRYFVKGTIKCMCKDIVGLDKMAKKYARDLYIEPYDGLVVGEEMESFIKTCLMYDMPALSKNTEFVEMVESYLLDIYEEKGATKCTRCGGYYPRTIMKRNVCIGCRKGLK